MTRREKPGMASDNVPRAIREPDFERHNQCQRLYFERSIKHTMVPSDSPYLRRHVAELLRFGHLSPGERVLEVGCGMGRYTFLLARHGLRVEALDLSPVLLERLRLFDVDRHEIRLHCGDLVNQVPTLDGQFDAVVGFFTLHHVHHLPACFHAIARLLRPSGRVVFLEPNPYNPLYYVQMSITPGMTWRGERGIVQMRRKPIFSAMREAGLTRLAMTRLGFFPPFAANREWGARLEAVLERVPGSSTLCAFQLFRAERS